jgi:CHAD domain-containing protein
MESTLERELKLEPPDGFELPALPGEQLETRLFTSTYYDTPGRSLGRVGITLRRRVENDVSRWQLKLPRGENARSEIEVADAPSAPPDEVRWLLTAHLRHGELEPVATLRTRRAGVRVADGDRSIADVTLDVVDVLDDGQATSGFSELEIELVDGDENDLKELGRTLRQAGARPSDGRPKVMRVLRLPEEQAPHPEAPTIERIRHLLTTQLRELEAHDPGVRTANDPEDLHKFRVATRRTRALARATQPLFGDRLEPLAAELKWLAALLGPVRDLDVLLGHLREEIATLGEDVPFAEPLLTSLEQERAAHRERLGAALDSERYMKLLDAFTAAIAALADVDVDGGLTPLAAVELGKLKKAADELPNDPADEQLHALRIRAKRARYTAELVDGKKVERYVAALKQLQDVVGEHQDAVVAEEKLRAVMRGRSAVAAGRLIEREHARRQARRAAYPAALEQAVRRGRKALGSG